MEIKKLVGRVGLGCDLRRFDDFIREFDGSSLGGTATTTHCDCDTIYHLDASGNQVCAEICGYTTVKELVTMDRAGDPVLPLEPDIPPFPIEPDPAPPNWGFEDVLDERLELIELSESNYGLKQEITDTKHGWWSPRSGLRADGRMVLRSFTATFTISYRLVD